MLEQAMDWVLHQYDEVDSTSTRCILAAERDVPEGYAVLATRQLSGRGTHGKVWYSRAGNLYLSFVLRPRDFAACLRAVPFITAVALFDTVSFVGPHIPLRLKWPNDLLVERGKLAGILIESGESASPWIVVGIGVNIAHAPDISGRLTTCLAHWNVASSPLSIAETLLDRVGVYLRDWRRFGFAFVRRAWEERSLSRGTLLAVSRRGEYITGTFEGLDERGGLLLKSAHGVIETFVAGEVSLLA